MTLTGRGGVVGLWLGAGALVRIARRADAPDEAVLRALVASELLSEEQLAQARAQAEQLGCLSIEVLVRDGHIDPAVAEAQAQLCSREALLHLLLLEEGDYLFEPSDAPPVPLHAPLRLEPLMLLALEDLDSYRALRRRIPSPRRVYSAQGSLEAYLALQTAVGATELRGKSAIYEDAAKASSEAADSAQNLAGVGHIERLVFSLLDGTRDVGKIVALVREGELPVLRALAWLLDHDLAKVVRAGPDPQEQGLLQPDVVAHSLRQSVAAAAGAARWVGCAAVFVCCVQWVHDTPRLAISAQAPQIVAWESGRAERARQRLLPPDAQRPTGPWRLGPQVCQEARGDLPVRPLE